MGILGKQASALACNLDKKTIYYIDFYVHLVYNLNVATEDVNGRPSDGMGDTFPSPDSSLSRRGLLRRFGASGAAGALGLVIPNHAEAADVTLGAPVYEPTVQRIETDVMPVDRIGWSFNVDIDLLKQLSANGSAGLEVLGSFERMSPRLIYKGQEDHGSRKFVSDGKTATLQVIPSLESDYVVLSATQSRDGSPLKASAPFVKLDYFTYTPDTPGDVRRIVSQTEINPDLLRELHERARLFDIFHFRTPVYIYRPVDGKFIASHDKSEHYIKLPVPFVEDPDFEQLPFMIEDHEQFHGAFSNINIRTVAERQAAIEVELAYNAAIRDIMSEMPEGTVVLGEGAFPNEVKNHPIFQAFDESNYYDAISGNDTEASENRVQENGDNGHPYDNVDEMAASGANCISRAGEHVVANVDDMKDATHKRDAERILRSIVGLADAISQHPESVDQNFPGFVAAREYINSNT